MRQLPRVVQVLVVLVALLAGGCAYLQTSHGFGLVIVPLASGFAPGSLEIRRGRFGLGGTLKAEGVQYSAPELGVAATVEDFDVNVGVWSLVFGTPHVESLRLHGAKVELSPGEEKPEEEEPEEESDDTEEDDDLLKRLRFVPASIGEADVQDVSVVIVNRENARTEIGPLELRVSQLVSGETGSIELSTPGSVSEQAESIDFRGDLALEAQVQQGPGGGIERVVAAIVANTEQGIGGEPTRFDLDLESTVDDEDVAASYKLVAAGGGTMLGEVEGTLATAETSDGKDAVEATLALRSIGESFLNPIIAPLGRGLIKRAQIDGTFELLAELPIDTTRLPHLAKGSLSVGRLDYRDLAISSVKLSFEASPDLLRAELAPTRINRGRLSGKASFLASHEMDTLKADLTASSLDLGAFSSSFREDVPKAVEGVLDLSASLASEAPPGADIRETANGSVRTKLRRGRIEGFNIMAFLAEQSGVDAFRAIPLDDFNVDASPTITDGVVHLEEASVKSTAVELLLNGTVALMGSVDLTIEAFVGPSLAGAVERLGVKLPTLAAAERLVSIPAAIQVSGPFANLSYGPAVARTPERAGAAADSGTESLQKAADKVKGWFK